jgi:serine/threonine protein kinase/formylglycine-generating enzyme required for sulfatase activity
MFDPWLDLTTENREDAPGEETVETGPGPGTDDMTRLPERIGRYRVERLLGQGGFGLVFLAYDEQLLRNVAVKVPHARLVSCLADADLYLTEARTVAGLDHAGIVPVYDVGSTDQFPCYVVSKFIDGETLAAKLRRERYNIAGAAELVATVAEALHDAHKQGLVHRDVKPGNILIDPRGRPFVVDFGLALREQDLGKGPRYAGTPSYMSPEQARGEGHRVDGRSDIFSLGLVFYELLLGRLPFQGQSREELMVQIITQEARPPRQLDERIPRELDRICMKALAKRATERYSTAHDMADDLRVFLAGQSEPPAPIAGGDLRPAVAAESPVPASGDLVPSSARPFKVVPKGLRSFDEHDADFFLELLPGPRDRDGLPESLRFWKSWIEETDPEKAAPVGLIYGPSGCGKSSLVKAGLMPRLCDRIIAIYVEATPNETETRLASGLRRRFPDLPESLGLRDSFAALRQGQTLPEGKKLVLILDQFEQWLHARREDENTLLVQALRQCDGEHVQCLAMVRDDFWMAATRFMRALEIRLLEGHNSAAVDLFDPAFARKVLASFGRAFGKLSEHALGRSRDTDHFLKEAVAGLAQEGKIVCVRLALFAEMMKGKPWTRATLSEVGGTRGVGFTFLEENFSNGAAPPEHRYHQQAARAVLQALLPESGTDIKGHMRSLGHLLEASGYSGRRQDFDDLIRILDSELRLITPTDPEGSGNDLDGPARLDAGQKYYQLTHDYLVHSLRDWLTRKQRETRRGRAAIRLIERSQLWSSKRENRFLPSTWEWANVRLMTSKRTWTEPQREMMKRAGRMHGLIALAALALLALGVVGAIEARRSLSASGLVASLKTASTGEVPSIINQLRGLRPWADPELRRLLRESDPSRREYLHASLALLADDPSQVDYLCARILAARAEELPVLREALVLYQSQVEPRLWSVLETARPGTPSLLPAASALALYCPTDSRWADHAEKVAGELVGIDLVSLKPWLELHRPIRTSLTAPLVTIFRDPDRSTTVRIVATTLLSEYIRDQPRLLADLLVDADADAYARLLPIVKDQKAATLPILREMVARPTAPAGGTGAETDDDRLAARQARAAVALLRMDQPDEAIILLRHSADPRVRGFLINWLGPLGADPRGLAATLEELGSDAKLPPGRGRQSLLEILYNPETSTRRALILAIGNYGEHELPREVRESLCTKLLELYRCDPDSGIHGAAEWVLRRWGEQAKLDAIVEQLSGEGPGPDRRWYVNSQRQTLAVIDGPVEFLMGSPPSEPHHLDYEALHRRIIPRRFAISTKEVSNDQYRRFLKENPEIDVANSAEFSPDGTGPASKPSWYNAAAYCNWLSEKEKLPKCYERNEHGRYAERMKIRADARTVLGYRLPTEAEWEFACRAGALCSRYYGTSRQLLKHYARYNLTSDGRAWPCGTLLPNDLGLFDMLGNLYEWCEEPKADYKPGPDGTIVDRVSTETVLAQNTFHILRGGGFVDVPAHVRSALRIWNLPHNQLGAYGFRIARTLP